MFSRSVSQMPQTPTDIAARFDAAMSASGVAEHHQSHFRRCLRFYLDSRRKYGLDSADAASSNAFEEKLRGKGQEPWKREQAH